MKYLVTPALFLFCFYHGLYAQTPDSGSIDSLIVTNVPEKATAETSYGLMSALEFRLSVGVLLFGMLVLLLEAMLIWKGLIDSNNIVKFIIVTLIVTGTLFLITAGYSNNQIAPALGLFGTVAGYLLGRTNTSSDEKASR
jgi:hypothetical protein